MTVETQGNKKSWIGDGSTTVYAYPYPFIEKDNIEVYLDGILQTEGYSIQTLSSYDSGANIIFESAPENGVIVLIRRNIGITQEVSYPENGEFPAKSHEGALDKLTLILLDNDSENIKLNPTSTELFNPILPAPVAKKGLRINDDGDGFELTEDNIDDILSDPGFQAISEDLLEGENSSIYRVANDLTNIDDVNANKENIDTVAESIEDVNAIGQNILSVLNVANDLTNIDAVSSNISDVNIVADSTENMITIVNNMPDVASAAAMLKAKVFHTVALMKSDVGLRENDVVLIEGYYSSNDGGSGFYIIRTKNVSDVEDGGLLHFLQNNLVAELLVNNCINLQQFGVIGDANYLYNGLWYKDSGHTTLATDNSPKLQNAINVANSRGLFIKLNGKNYKSSTDIVLPTKGFIDNGGIVGCTCTWQMVKEVITNGTLVFDTLNIKGMWHSLIDKLKVTGNLTIDGYNNIWGTYWNKFNSIQAGGVLGIDCDHGSINQNLFTDIKTVGGLHIYGTNTSGLRECHANQFISIDTTGANLTDKDGETGFHILNDSDLNQTNIIKSWYSESTGNRRIKGNWHIIGSNIDANTQSFNQLRQDHSLFATTPVGARAGADFFSGSPKNALIGGDWKYLGKEGTPLNMSFANTFHEVRGVDDAPDGNPLAVYCRANTPWANIPFMIPVNSLNMSNLSLYIKFLGGDKPKDIEVINNTGIGYAGYSLTDVGNGWYLLRSSITARTVPNFQNLVNGHYNGDGTTQNYNNFYTTMKLYLTYGTNDNPPEFLVGSIFAGKEKTNFLPQFDQSPKEARSNVIPTGGIWRVGDRCYNSNPSSGNPIGWICTTTGDCRTLSDVTGSITTGTTELTVNDASKLYVGANITIAGVTGTKVIHKIEDTTITIDSNADATVTDGAISFVAPVWASMGNLS